MTAVCLQNRNSSSGCLRHLGECTRMDVGWPISPEHPLCTLVPSFVHNWVTWSYFHIGTGFWPHLIRFLQTVDGAPAFLWFLWAPRSWWHSWTSPSQLLRPQVYPLFGFFNSFGIVRLGKTLLMCIVVFRLSWWMTGQEAVLYKLTPVPHPVLTLLHSCFYFSCVLTVNSSCFG